MPDPSESEPSSPATTRPAERDVTTPVAEPVVVAEPVATTAVVAEPAQAGPVATTAVVAEPVAKKKRGLGAWSFVLGLLTALADIGFAVYFVVTAASLIGDLTAGTLGDLTEGDLTEGDLGDLGISISTAIGGSGLVLVALFVFFGGFLTAGIGGLLGLIALISGRGRVLGAVGLLFALGAIVVRVLLLQGGSLLPGLGFIPGLDFVPGLGG